MKRCAFTTGWREAMRRIDNPLAYVNGVQAMCRAADLLSMWTICERPTDFPTGYTARCHVVGNGVFGHTQECICGDLEMLREVLDSAGLICMPRDPSDEAQIVETWV
jgi:hypothetical protein